MASSGLVGPSVGFDFRVVSRSGPTLSERVEGSRELAAFRWLARQICRGLGRIEFTGMENLPATGPVLLAANHRSLIDGPLLFGFLGRVVSCIVKVEAFLPVGGRSGQVLVRAAQVPVNRFRVDPGPVRLAIDILDAGGVVGIFPEGTRGDGLVALARPGVGYLALKTGAIVVPVAIHGSASMVRRRRPSRPRVLVALGAPIVLDPPRRGRWGVLNRSSWLAATETIRLGVAQLVERTRPEPFDRTPEPDAALGTPARPPAA